MPRNLSPLAIVGTGVAVLTAVMPAVSALATPADRAPTVSATTVAGQVNTVAAERSQLTVRTRSGRIETIKVAAGGVLVHGIPSAVRAVHAGMTVLAQGHQVNATTFDASAVRAFTPAAATSTMRGVVGTVDRAGRMVVVMTAPYQTAVSYLMPGITVTGPNGSSGAGLLQRGASVTFSGHADSQDPSELLASTATVGGVLLTAAR